MGVASLVLKPRLPKFVKSHNFKRYISDMISIKIVPLISDLGKTPLSVPSIFKGVLALFHKIPIDYNIMSAALYKSIFCES